MDQNANAFQHPAPLLSSGRGDRPVPHLSRYFLYSGPQLIADAFLSGQGVMHRYRAHPDLGGNIRQSDFRHL